MRTSLALFGIVWGTVAVILLLALGNGFYAANSKNLAFLNNGTIFIWIGATSKPFAGLAPGQKLHLNTKDFLATMFGIPGIKNFSPVYMEKQKIQSIDKHITGSVHGVAASYNQIEQIDVAVGRFINELDIEQKKRVVFLDAEIKLALFGQQEAIGKFISIQGIPFIVIGIANASHKGMMMWMSNTVFIPYTTFLSIWGERDVGLFYIQPLVFNNAAVIKHSLRNTLAMRFQFDPTDEQVLMIPNLEEAQVFFKWFFRGIELFLGFCGILTLSVGGLGIANMMFLIVTERTREIGLRMALGAEEFHIMLQFMLETLLLVGLGGTIGFIIAMSCISLLQNMRLPDWLGSPQISWLTILATMGILLLVGVIAGYFPARRAARMEPVKALAF